MMLRHARGQIDTSRCFVMGIVNRTPDSFYDGGRMDLAESAEYAHSLVDQGADVLDLGAVRAGPGAPVEEAEEMRRLLPLVESLASATGVPLSIETSRARVAEVALAAGAAIVNDVSGFADPAMPGVIAASGAGVVIMHHGGQLRGRPLNPRYPDVVANVTAYWQEKLKELEAEGVDRSNVIFDNGLDFGKTTFHSLELMNRLDEQVTIGPVLVAPSRKDIVGETLDVPPAERLEGTLALVALAVRVGVAGVRVHDVAEAVRVVRMVEAVGGKRRPASPIRGLWE